jgi:hypothetical protein
MRRWRSIIGRLSSRKTCSSEKIWYTHDYSNRITADFVAGIVGYSASHSKSGVTLSPKLMTLCLVANNKELKNQRLLLDHNFIGHIQLRL